MREWEHLSFAPLSASGRRYKDACILTSSWRRTRNKSHFWVSTRAHAKSLQTRNASCEINVESITIWCFLGKRSFCGMHSLSRRCLKYFLRRSSFLWIGCSKYNWSGSKLKTNDFRIYLWCTKDTYLRKYNFLMHCKSQWIACTLHIKKMVRSNAACYAQSF